VAAAVAAAAAAAEAAAPSRLRTSSWERPCDPASRYRSDAAKASARLAASLALSAA